MIVISILLASSRKRVTNLIGSTTISVENQPMHLHSDQFIRLLQQNSHEYMNGEYHFDTLHSGLYLHGGCFTAQQDFQCSRLVNGYISFVLLLEGELDFAINQNRYHVQSESGRIVMIAVQEEFLFSRYLHYNQNVVKLTLKGLETWLSSTTSAVLLPALYREPVRVWDMSEEIRQLTLCCLKKNTHTSGLQGRLDHEATILHLASSIWQSLQKQFPLSADKAEQPVHETSFTQQLNQAFHSGVGQVAALAAALHISERTLQRKLHEQFGLTAREWLRHKHMKAALSWLLNDQLSIGEIAYRCGYRHVSSFTQAFRIYFGSTPAQLREHCQSAVPTVNSFEN